MRKLLLSFCAIIGIVFAGYADSVNFDFLNNTYGMARLSGNTSQYNADPCEVTQDGSPVMITLTGKTRLWEDGLRFYKSAAFKITAPGYVIKSVTFGKNQAKFNYNGSALSAAKWTSADGVSEVEFACNITTKNVAVNTLTVEYEQAGDPDKEDAGLTYDKTEYSIEFGDEFVAPRLVNPNNLAVTYSSSVESVATVAADGTVTVVAPGTTVISAKSEETDKYNSGSASYTLTVVDVLHEAADIYNLAKGDKFVLKEPVTVFYVSGKYVYASGATRNVLLYDGTSYPVGTVINRLEGTIDVYNGLYEVTAYTAETAAESGATISPKVMKVADITADNICDYIFIDNADISDVEKKNGTISQNGNTIALYNNFGLTDVTDRQNVDITAIVSVFGSTIQVQPISIEITTGIEEITADDASAVYYNLQGVKVGDDAKGLLISRRGDKTVKVVKK